MNMWLMLLIIAVSMFISLLLRLKLERIPRGKMIEAFNLSIKYLIVYPFILFPHLVRMYKYDIAEVLYDVYYKQLRGYGRSRKVIIEKIAESMDREMIKRVWHSFLKDTIRDYSSYTDRNIEAVKNIVCTDKIIVDKFEEIYVDNNQNQFQKNIKLDIHVSNKDTHYRNVQEKYISQVVQ